MTHENKDYIAALRSKGYRVTPQRLIVLDAICEAHGHATLTDIQQSVHLMDPTIDRSTIYRTLTVLRDVGLIVEAEIGHEGKVYRIAGEANHLHLVCLSCSNTVLIERSQLDETLQYIQNTYGFQVQADHLVLNGFCNNCQNNE